MEKFFTCGSGAVSCIDDRRLYPRYGIVDIWACQGSIIIDKIKKSVPFLGVRFKTLSVSDSGIGDRLTRVQDSL